MVWRVRGGELPLSRTLVDPELHYGQISTTQKDGTPPFPRRNAHSRTLYSMVPVAGHPIIMCGTSGCSGSCSLSAVENGYEAGKKPATCQTCGRIFPRPNGRNVSPVTSRSSRNTSPCLDGQVWFPGATHRAIKRCQKVWRQSWRNARNLIRLGTKCWVNSLGVMWEQHCRPLWAPVRPASRCRILLVSLLQ